MFVPRLNSICGRQVLEHNVKLFSIGAVNCNDGKPPSDGDNKKVEASEKLKSLLKSIIEDDLASGKPDVKVQKVELPQPRLLHRKKKAALKEQVKKVKTLGEQIVSAAQKVAEDVPGDKKETEAQLLHKLLYKNTPLSQEITNAAPSLNLTNLLSKMKIEKEEVQKPKDVLPIKTRSQEIKHILGDKKAFLKPTGGYVASKTALERVNLFGGKLLGIFKSENFPPESKDSILQTWHDCNNKELRLSATQPPSNIYEQMIIWTDRGMLWKFPIDNEQGLEEEKNVSFEDHIFLEVHLEGWCPDKGPIRHFMELVCVGLSRNYWLTAKEKKDHIMWYKEFFSSTKAIIKEVGAGEIQSEVQAQQ